MSKNKITYDDILQSLSMKVENGRLVINRDINQEYARAGIPPPPPPPKQPQKQLQHRQQQNPLHHPNQHQQQPLKQLTPLEKLKLSLEQKQRLKDSKTKQMFDIKRSKRVQMNI